VLTGFQKGRAQQTRCKYIYNNATTDHVSGVFTGTNVIELINGERPKKN